MTPAEILIVDDIPANLKLLTDILTEEGYRVRPAGGGYLALRSVAIRLPDLILLDVKMPDMDGYEVCRRLKSDEKSRHIPVLFVSALDDTADKVKGFMAGGVDYITKPFQAEEVLARVEMHLALHRLQEQLEAQNTLLQMEIAERKRAEEEKEKIEAQNRQLQKAESLGRMAGAIAHHFNNQLGVVMGNLELAMLDLPQETMPYASLAAAMKASRRAAEVSGLMLTYLGQTPGKRESLDLSEICRRNLPLLRAAMPKHVAMETDLPFPGPTLSADAGRIPQVLTNLVTNAWESFGCESGAIHLRVETVFSADIPSTNRFPIGWQPHDNAYACLEVADAGCGIADADIEKIFDPFFSSKFTGRGLGLSVVLGIVRAHGGAITVESEPGQGSVFRVFLPLSAEDIPRQPEKPSKARELEGGGTVLLVEDEEMLRNMAEAMLTRLGFAVLSAGDGVEALEMFRRHQGEIRCVLSDLTMPLMNGWELLDAMRRLDPGIPVVLASGYDKAHVMAGHHSEWPQAFLSKPYQIEELGDAIRHALTAHASTSPEPS